MTEPVAWAAVGCIAFLFLGLVEFIVFWLFGRRRSR